MIEFRPATAELVEAFYGKPSPLTLRAYVCLVDGVPAGVVGIANEGGHKVAFSDIDPAYRGHRDQRRAIVKGIRLMRAMLEATPVPVYVQPNPDEPTAPALLARLGFVPTGHDNTLVRP